MPHMTQPANPSRVRVLPVLLIALVAIGGLVFLRDVLSLDSLRDHREALLSYRDANYGLTALLFILAYTAIVGFSLPGATIATLAGGFLFATFPGVVFNLIGATLGATLIFVAVRWGFGDRMVARIDVGDGRIKRIKDGIAENQWSMLFLLRLLPAVPFFLANLLPAFFGVPLYRYVITTFFGIMPGAVVLTSVGAGLGEVFAADGTPDLGVIFTPPILFPILGLCALAALPVVIKALRGGKEL